MVRSRSLASVLVQAGTDPFWGTRHQHVSSPRSSPGLPSGSCHVQPRRVLRRTRRPRRGGRRRRRTDYYGADYPGPTRRCRRPDRGGRRRSTRSTPMSWCCGGPMPSWVRWRPKGGLKCSRRRTSSCSKRGPQRERPSSPRARERAHALPRAGADPWLGWQHRPPRLLQQLRAARVVPRRRPRVPALEPATAAAVLLPDRPGRPGRSSCSRSRSSVNRGSDDLVFFTSLEHERPAAVARAAASSSASSPSS